MSPVEETHWNVWYVTFQFLVALILIITNCLLNLEKEKETVPGTYRSFFFLYPNYSIICFGIDCIPTILPKYIEIKTFLKILVKPIGKQVKLLNKLMIGSIFLENYLL